MVINPPRPVAQALVAHVDGRPSRERINPITFAISSGAIGNQLKIELRLVRSVSPVVLPEHWQLTGSDCSLFDCREQIMYSRPPLRAKSLRPAAGSDVYLFESRKKISTGECPVEVRPKIGIKRLSPRVDINDGDIVHPRKRREVLERFFPKLNISLVGLRPDGQRFQGPFL